MFMKKFLSLLSAFLLMVVPLFGQQLRVFTIGDSTVQDYNDGYAPRKGWGQMLPFFFDKSKAVVYNKAIGGTSSKSFYEKHWAAVRGQLQKGDYVFIQFGINDRNSSDANRYAPKGVFEGYIKKFVADVRAKGAIPVLVSTVRRCAWTNGKPYDSYHEHPQLMRDVAKEVSAPLVDLDKFCYDLFVAQGELYAQRYLTMHLQAGEYANYKNGASDQVHYQEIGATENARFVVESIEKSNDADLKKLAACTLPRYKVTFKINDPSKAKTVSRSAEFPAGINVTLKTIPQNGAKFIRWEDGSGKSVATKSLHVLKMGSADVTYKAVYESNIKETIEPTLSINNQNKSLVASEAKSYKWYFNNKVISGETKSSLAISQNGTYSVEMVLNDGTTAKLHICVTIGKDGVIRKIYLIGDSTVCNYKDSQYPMTGWGQVLKYFFNSDIKIDNHAIGGRSSRSFIEQGRWKTVRDALQPGDFVFVQFGHNDRDTKPERYTSVADYKKNMKMFINEAREKGAIPVLVSPMVMNAWNNAGMRNVFTENGNNYRGAMAEVADEMKCTFVDLNMKSYNLFKTTSANYCSRFFYHTYPAGEYPNYPNGSSDGTHFQEMGALTLCKLVTDGLKESKDPFIQSLVNYMKPQYTLTVKANKDKSGDITMSNSFPEGAPITVKVLPSNGSKFVNWSRDGKNVSSKTLYRFSMGSQNTELTAIFEGGAAVDTVVKIDFPEGKKRVAYITDPNAANYANDTKILPALKACDSLFVYEVNAAKNNVDLADFDMVVISEVAASTAARIASLKSADKPTLTMKVHAYKEAAGAWGWAENGFGDNYEATNVKVSDAGKGHPIFSVVKLSESGELQMVSEVNDKALTYMNPANFSSVSGGEIVELASISGEEQCSIFEIPAGTTVSGTTLKSAMVQVGLNSSSYANITEDGVKVLQNACYYLLGMKMPAEEATDVTSVNADACAVYPNLVRDVLFVRNGTDEVFSANLTLTSLNGSVLAQMMVTLNEGVNSISRDGLSVPAGLYVVSLTDKKGSELFKGITIFK
jgi:lysophospholipase L1-like esterase